MLIFVFMEIKILSDHIYLAIGGKYRSGDLVNGFHISKAEMILPDTIAHFDVFKDGVVSKNVIHEYLMEIGLSDSYLLHENVIMAYFVTKYNDHFK